MQSSYDVTEIMYNFVFDGNEKVAAFIHEGYYLPTLLESSRVDLNTLSVFLKKFPDDIVTALHGSFRTTDNKLIDAATYASLTKAPSFSAQKPPTKFFRKNREIKLDNVISSTIPVEVSTASSTRSIPLNQLLSESFDNNKPVVITFTPGPFQDNDPLPADWKIVPAANGCTTQLKTFEANFERLNATVFAINKHPASYHQRLIKDKKLTHVQMISDAKAELETLFNLEHELLFINDNYYFPRFSLVLIPTADGIISSRVPLQSPVTDKIAENHIQEIEELIHPELTRQLDEKPAP